MPAWRVRIAIGAAISGTPDREVTPVAPGALMASIVLPAAAIGFGVRSAGRHGRDVVPHDPCHAIDLDGGVALTFDAAEV
jgi:hypothetical protein